MRYATHNMLGIVVCFSISACGSPEQTRAEPAQGEAIEELSFHEHCDTVSPPDHVVMGNDNNILATPTYDHSACRNAYIIDVKGYQPLPDHSQGFTGIWPSGVPVTQADCQRAQTLAYVWETTSGVPVPMDAVSFTGNWQANPPNCSTPRLQLTGSLRPVPGHSYRYAVSARQLTASGSYTERNLVMEVN